MSVNWADTASRVEALAAGLLAVGIEPEQRIAIASSTRYEWILADLAIVCAGAATAVLDHDLTVEGGELTPSMKVKRALVAQRYRELIDSLYA